MRPLIRLYLEEQPNIDAIRLQDAVILAMNASEARSTLFPGKRTGFDHYHIRDDLYVKLLAELTVARQPEIERADARRHIENGSLEKQLQGTGIPEWFEKKLTQRDDGIIKLDTIAYERFKDSTPKEQQLIAAFAELSGLNHYAQILTRTKGAPTYIAEASIAFGKPNISAYNALGHLASSMLRHKGFISVTDELHRSYVDGKFHHEAHYDAHRKEFESITNNKRLLSALKNRN